LAIATLTSRTRVATFPEVALNARQVGSMPHTWYTCPAGKKAIIKGKITCTEEGAATETQFVAAGVIMFRFEKVSIGFVNTSITDDSEIVYSANGTQFVTPENVYMHFEVTLAAGETILSQQNSGDNSEFNLFASVLELPA